MSSSKAQAEAGLHEGTKHTGCNLISEGSVGSCCSPRRVHARMGILHYANNAIIAVAFILYCQCVILSAYAVFKADVPQYTYIGAVRLGPHATACCIQQHWLHVVALNKDLPLAAMLPCSILRCPIVSNSKSLQEEPHVSYADSALTNAGRLP